MLKFDTPVSDINALYSRRSLLVHIVYLQLELLAQHLSNMILALLFCFVIFENFGVAAQLNIQQ